ncbi:TIGR03364 family FAD-dependent oxidoreductase [Paeniglutamicibacter kerguelensis]|uniref:FAD dependent oxidoreductase TIGR03364 n=1 Tax=Paeniglutamicibacter kerguelensis TaxID=254788 RepID=A0ABS4XIA0_9MICC|nr:FAD dependent oxidoreductase TIGR03364 [Paeniglutamicibacter kerguelensis]
MTGASHFDLAVVGAGVIGLAHAALALEQGQRVVVIERNDRPVGASIRNFGHVGITTQEGEGLDYALAGRKHWLRLAEQAGFWIREAGTLIVARAEDEWELLNRFAGDRGDAVELLTPGQVRDVATIRDPSLVGAAFCGNDLRVNSVEAIPSIASWLAGQGVEFRYRTQVSGIDSGIVQTSRGDVHASKIVVAAGHDTDRLFPDLAEEAEIERCLLHMLEVDAPEGSHFDPVILTGTAVLRYGGLATCDAADSIRERMHRESPELMEAFVNVKMSQRPNGRLVIGDTHAYAHTHDPFKDEELDNLLLREFERLLGAPLTVRQRWHGQYAFSKKEAFFVREPKPGVLIACVTNGTGMSTGMGFAESVLNRF